MSLPDFETDISDRETGRLEFLAILKNHEESRKAARLNQRMKEKQIIELWKKEERKQSLKRLKSFFKRLEKPKESIMLKKAPKNNFLKSIKLNNFSRIEHSENEKAISINKKLEEKTEANKLRMMERIEKAMITHERSQSFKSQTLHYKSIALNNRILKARINKVLSQKNFQIYEHCKKDSKIPKVNLKENMRRFYYSSPNKELSPIKRFRISPEPNTLLLENFNIKELAKVFYSLMYR